MNKNSSTSSTKAGRPKEVTEILEEQLDTGLKEFKRSHSHLFISAFAAGLEIGFSLLFMGSIFTLFNGDVSAEQMKLFLGLGYSVGFIFVIIGRSELFTEHTALAILPVLDKSASLKELLTLWGLVYSGNLIGGYIFSLIITNIAPAVGFINYDAFHHIAHELVDYKWQTIFLSALLAGWMMGLLGWLVTSSQETISRILVIVLVTFIIGLTGLHHCIVGSIEVFSGFLTSSSITFDSYLKFQIWATLGNAIGGAVFVSVLKYGHANNDR
ncbi:MAG: formate/nitrite transporter family protein [Cyclobacteriaceae bacterium]|nr:formate/nitrite transporter family protein [Cyclobacteriaceae bacterium]